MFIVNPDFYSLPCYRIGPFKTDHISFNHQLPKNDFAVSYFDGKFGKGNWQYTFNGREAIRLALQSFNLDKNDLVTIITTSQNFYISSCVTNSIAKFCRWNREILPETKIIFVNHEFGHPYPDMDTLVASGIPIIEDCCTTFFSQDENQMIGKYGDFSLYSFPKFFTIQSGGLIISNKQRKASKSILLDDIHTQYIENVISNSLEQVDEILQIKKSNFDYGVAKFEAMGFSLRFPKMKGTVPSVLLLNNNGIVKDIDRLKFFLNNHGIQNSIFYGEDAFFIPNHQSLTMTDIDYFSYLISHYINN
jgi:hypothetical protein